MATKRTYGLLLALVFIGIGTSAYGYDKKIYGGVACHPESGTDARYFERSSYIQNIDSSNHRVVCPVVRDLTQNGDGAMTYVYVRSDGHELLICTLSVYRSDGLFVSSASDATTESYEPDGLHLHLHTSEEDGYYHITCDLPPNGRIYNYDFWEYNGTSNDGN